MTYDLLQPYITGSKPRTRMKHSLRIIDTIDTTATVTLLEIETTRTRITSYTTLAMDLATSVIETDNIQVRNIVLSVVNKDISL